MKALLLLIYFYMAVGFCSNKYTINLTEDNPGELKNKALQVLVVKCNQCHRKQNPSKVFNDANLKRLAPEIYQQVFILNRMPKGSKVKLTEEERKTLLTWLKTEITMIK